jgi:cell division protein FtsI/penicillin-binding protein 2
MNMGWDVKKEIGELYEHTFCSSVFMPSKQGTILTSLPGRILGKVFCSNKQYVKQKQQKYYCNVVSRGLICDNQHNPIIHALLKRLISLTEVKIKDNKLGFMREYDNKYQSFEHIEENIEMSPEIFNFYLNRYNISPTEVFELVEYMNNIPHFKCGLSHPVIDKIVKTDIEEVEKDAVELERGKFWDVVKYSKRAPIDSFQWWCALYKDVS